jgi:hypothetical protein
VTPIPLFVELCAGTAALSLRLHRDGAKPPVSRMGSKSGYASALLRILGLRPGQRAAAYLWCEPDPGVRLLLHAYRDAGLAKAAAAVIRGWAAEDPRALWERLRAEGPPRLLDGEVDAGEVARWGLLGAWAYRSGHPESGPAGEGRWADTPWHDRSGVVVATRVGTTAASVAGKYTDTPTLPATITPATITPDARTIDPREVARWAQITASNRLIHTAWSDTEGRWVNTGDGGCTFGGPAFCSPPERTAEGMEAAPADVPAVVVPDARAVDPREVARMVAVGQLSYRQMEPSSGFNPGMAADAKSPCWRHGLQEVSAALAGREPLPALIHPDARDIDPPALPPGTVAYMDGPYENTTQYANLLPRAEQVAIARRWAAAGATVAISEAEAIPELVAEGWYAVEITGERIGAARTFSKQKREWVTLNQPPAWVPPVQGSLF